MPASRLWRPVPDCAGSRYTFPPAAARSLMGSLRSVKSEANTFNRTRSSVMISTMPVSSTSPHTRTFVPMVSVHSRLLLSQTTPVIGYAILRCGIREWERSPYHKMRDYFDLCMANC